MMVTRGKLLQVAGAFLLATTLLGSSCGGSDSTATSDPTDQTDQTEVTQTDDQPASPGTQAQSPGTPAPVTDPPEVTEVLERASGSGCTPESATSLPDGRWFGYVGDSQGDATADEVVFDLACWWESDAADDAADVFNADPPDNGYFIRNANEHLRTLSVAADATATWLPDGVTDTDVSYEEWRLARLGRTYLPGVWLTIDGGEIVQVVEQYQP